VTELIKLFDRMKEREIKVDSNFWLEKLGKWWVNFRKRRTRRRAGVRD
jgi:hypothetical protein